MSLVLGVDVGSQSIKAVLVDEAGDVVASGSAALTMVHEHDGWADQDPHTYCTALRDAVRAATDRRAGGSSRGDGPGQPGRRRRRVRCRRCAAAPGDHLAGQTGHRTMRSAGLPRWAPNVLAERTGLVADASHSAPKMMWIREHEPRVWQRAACWRRSDRMCCTTSPARTRRTPRTRRPRWCTTSPAAISTQSCVQAAGLDPAMLPPVRPSTEVVGTLRPDVAAELGLPRALRGGRRHRRRTRRVGRGGCDRARRRRRRHRHRRTGDDRRLDARPRSTLPWWRPTAMRCPVRGWSRIPDSSAAAAHCGSPPGCSACRRPRCSRGARQAPPASEGVLFLPALSGSTAPRWNDRDAWRVCSASG